jgi:hypothetical protein
MMSCLKRRSGTSWLWLGAFISKNLRPLWPFEARHPNDSIPFEADGQACMLVSRWPFRDLQVL